MGASTDIRPADSRLALVEPDRESGFPVVIADGVPAYRFGLSAAFAEAGFHPDEPVDLERWARLPGRRGLLISVSSAEDYETIRSFRTANDELIVVALLRDAVPEMYVRALQAGASGAVSWTSPPDAVIAVVQAAREQQLLLPRDVVEAIASGIVVAPTLRGVRQAEKAWLQMMADGHTVSDLARAIGYSEREMFRLLRSLYERMGVKNRTEALLKAAQCGLLI
jgi:DNA-binding NarL/FixJ family response regulator